MPRTLHRPSIAEQRKRAAYAARLAEAWLNTERAYIEGYTVPGEPGARHWPSIEEAAEREGLLGMVALQTIQRRARGEHWADSQANAKAAYRAAIDAVVTERLQERGRDLAVQKLSFDDDVFGAARGALARAAEGIASLRMREPMYDRDGRPDGFRASRDGALTLRALTIAILAAQRAGRLAIGLSTDNVSWRDGRGRLGRDDDPMAVIDLSGYSDEQLAAIEDVMNLLPDTTPTPPNGLREP